MKFKSITNCVHRDGRCRVPSPGDARHRPYSVLLSILLTLCFVQPGDGTSQMHGQGRVSALLALSSAPVGGASTTVTTTVTGHAGGSPGAGGGPPTGDFTDVLDFGDLTVGTGEPVVGAVAVRLKGNANYTLNLSQLSFSAKDLLVNNKDVSGTEDHGTFITVRLGPPVATGGRGNSAQTRINGAMNAGMTLDNLSIGQVTPESTRIADGEAPSLGGTMTSTDNAVDIPLYFSVPSGYAIGPVAGAAKGVFQVTLQVGIFAGG